MVALSRRLREALAEMHRAQFRPGAERRVLPGFDPYNFHDRGWTMILRRAEIGDRSPKDLRDSYASWLLSLGVQLAWVSRQLGHVDIEVTARHYSKWCGGDVYRDPMALAEGELPPDLLARVVAESPQSPRESPQRHDTVSGEGTGAMAAGAENASGDAHFTDGGGMVTQAGFEPATPSFGGWCSIQLSYWARA